MTSGGARTRSGPMADPNALKRDFDRREWTRLPKTGCTLDPPEWPHEHGEPSVRELALWQRLWKTPQAIVWHNDGAADMVVVYIRALLQATKPQAGPGILASFRQYGEQLLLTIPALRAQRYYIEGDDFDAALSQDPDAAPVPAQSLEKTGTEGAGVVRGRFKVVRPQVDDDDDSDPRVADE